jgi:Na+-driven multidrug efflux pump
MLMQPMGTLSTACSTFVSQNWGAKQYRRIKMGLRQVMGMELLWSLIAIVIVYLFAGNLVMLISGTENPEVLSNATMSMRLCVVGFPALGILLCLRTSMQSMGKKVAPVLSSCVELAMKALAAWVLIPLYGYLGSCISEPLTWVAMVLFLGAAYLLQRKRIYPAEEG